MDAGGRISTWARQLGTQSDQYAFGYDAVGQLTHALQTSGATTLSKSDYSYDDAGNRSSTQTGDALTHTLSDQTNVPISTQGGGPVRFAGQLSKPASVTVAGFAATVDNRNRFETKVNLSAGSQTVPVVATDPSDNSTITHNYQVNVTAGSPRAYGRDNNGNITSSTSPDGSGAPNSTYEWDAADRLVAINIGTHRTELRYDGFGRRVHLTEKDSGYITSDRRFLWNGTELLEERDGVGGTVTKRFFGQGEQRIGGADAGAYFSTRDHLGSVRELVDASGAIRARYDYGVWGQRTMLAGDLSSDFGFTGHYFHEASGLHLTLYRTYDANLGKWVSRDPIAENGGLNLYGYVGNDPILHRDPLGLYDYSEAQTRKVFLRPAFIYATAGPIEGIMNIRDNSQGLGPYDFGWNDHRNDTFCVNGQRMNADEFGNYIAGYQGAAYDGNVISPFPALDAVYAAGLFYHLTGDTKAVNDPFDNTGRPLITRGANDAPQSVLVRVVTALLFGK